jgi:hypothetical protein
MTDGLIAYASRTGTARNLAAMRAHGWRILVSATGEHRHEGFTREVGLGYALDNGAWTSRGGGTWDVDAFDRLLSAFGEGADWAVAPDVVGQAEESLRLTLRWLPRMLDSTPKVLVAVQNGMVSSDVERLLGPRVGIAVGGGCPEHSPALRFGLCKACDWKEQSALNVWGPLAREVGCHLHIPGIDALGGTLVSLVVDEGGHECWWRP